MTVLRIPVNVKPSPIPQVARVFTNFLQEKDEYYRSYDKEFLEAIILSSRLGENGIYYFSAGDFGVYAVRSNEPRAAQKFLKTEAPRNETLQEGNIGDLYYRIITYTRKHAKVKSA